MAEPTSIDAVIITLLLRKVHDGSRLTLGRRVTLQRGDVVGRGDTATVQLDDASVSRTHVVVEQQAGTLWLRNVSRDNTLLVDGVAVEAAQQAELSSSAQRVQIGGLLFSIERPSSDDATQPVREVLTLSDTTSSSAGPAFVIQTDGDACTVSMRGRLLDVSAGAARALRALAATPGQVVHEWDIQTEVGTRANIAQLMSSVRRAVKAAVVEGVATEAELRTWIGAVRTPGSDQGLNGLAGAALLRRLFWARRGHGYAWMIPPDVVRIDRV